MENEQQEVTIEQEIHQAKKKRKKGLFVLWLFLAVLLLAGGVLFFKTGRTFQAISLGANDWQKAQDILPEPSDTSSKDPNRLNILLLGLRGADDPSGGLLTDTMMIASIKRDTNQIALISVPRDLYIDMPNYPKKQKINFAYALGEERSRNGGGLVYSRQVISQVTGLYIDYVAAVNFTAFEEVVNELGGVDVYRDQPFSERTQWLYEGKEGKDYWRKSASSTWEFYVPAGSSHMNGEAALYYVRSRYSTSDFDRMRRQQQVIQALKAKAFSLGVLANPIKVYNLLGSVERNVRTNLTFEQIKGLLPLSNDIDFNNIKSLVFDTAADGPLYSSTSDGGAYIILPKDENFDKVRQMCRNIFD